MPPKKKSATEKRKADQSAEKKAKRPKRPQPRSTFLQTEAIGEDDRSADDQRTSEEEQGEGEVALTADSFIDDTSVNEGASSSTHAAFDNTRESEESLSYSQVISSVGSRSRPPESREERSQYASNPEESANRDSIPPYFPLGLASSQEQPTQFNFELFVLDTLILPRGLFPDDERLEIDFENTKDCTEYCERYLEGRLKELEHSREEDHTEERRAQLSKEEMFHSSGELISNITTGNPVYDNNLDSVRVDIYGNVMVLGAPNWSDLSPQFTHGFPRRLVRESHRGLLAGNLTVAARISNQAIRSLAVGDIACFLSRKMIKGLGLTVSELVLARSSAIKYAGRRQKPSRLIDTMLRFGIDFLKMKALTDQQVSDLRGTSTIHWDQILHRENADHSDSSDSGSDSNSELEVPASWDVQHECGDSMLSPSSAEHSKSVRLQVRNLLSSYLMSSVQPQQAVLPAVVTTQTRRNPRTSGQRKKRQGKRKGPTMPAIPSIETDTEENTSRPDARAALTRLEGLVPARIPKDDSLERLSEYLSAHQPLASEEVRVGGSDAGDPFQRHYQSERLQLVKQAKGALWVASQADCICLAEPSAGSSQTSAPDENCPYCRCTQEGGELHSVNRKCGSERCRVCGLIDHCEVDTLVQLGVDKNAALTARLELSAHMAHILNAGDIAPDRMTAITTALCSLLGCKQTKLRNIANAGFLTLMCPRLCHLQLHKGWGNLWSNLSKIGSAVGHHENRCAQLAALIFVRKRCIAEAESSWHYYLQTDDDKEEEEILESVFEGCFE